MSNIRHPADMGLSVSRRGRGQAQMLRANLTLDQETMDGAKALGEGNMSSGLRSAVRQANFFAAHDIRWFKHDSTVNGRPGVLVVFKDVREPNKVEASATIPIDAFEGEDMLALKKSYQLLHANNRDLRFCAVEMEDAAERKRVLAEARKLFRV